MLKDIRNITKQVLYEEVIQGIKGLAYEIGLPDIMFFETTEGAIKNAAAAEVCEDDAKKIKRDEYEGGWYFLIHL